MGQGYPSILCYEHTNTLLLKTVLPFYNPFTYYLVNSFLYSFIALYGLCEYVHSRVRHYGLRPPSLSIHVIFREGYLSGLPFPTSGELPNWDWTRISCTGRWILFFFLIFIFNWLMIALQFWFDFYHTLTWINHRCTYVPFRLGYYRASVWVPWVIQQIRSGNLFTYISVYASMLLSPFISLFSSSPLPSMSVSIGKWILYHWATWEAPFFSKLKMNFLGTKCLSSKTSLCTRRSN